MIGMRPSASVCLTPAIGIPAGHIGPAVPLFFPGRQFHNPEVRRNRAGAFHFQTTCRNDGRPASVSRARTARGPPSGSRPFLKKQLTGREKTRVVPEDIRGKRMLIVDDNGTNRYVMRGTAQFMGLSLWRSSQRLKRRWIASIEPVSVNDAYDIAILDMQMPGMDGGRTGAANQAVVGPAAYHSGVDDIHG